MVTRGVVACAAGAVAALLALVGLPRRAAAHPIHASFAEVTYDRGARVVRVSLRVFADDFLAEVVRRTGATPGVDGSPPAAAVLRYVASRFTVVTSRGAALAFRACGVRRAGAQLFVCLEADAPAPPAGARVRSAVLSDVFADQVNVVQVAVDATRRTLLFSPGDGAKAL